MIARVRASMQPLTTVAHELAPLLDEAVTGERG